MFILAILNVYRWEVLAGLWLRRRFMRLMLRSAGDREVVGMMRRNERDLFSFKALVGSRYYAVLLMTYSSFTGAAVGVILSGILAAVSRATGFPGVLTFLSFFVGLCSWGTMAIGLAVAKLGPIPAENPDPEYNGDIGWDYDVEGNPRVGLGISVCGIGISLLGAWLMVTYLPHPSTWG